VRPWASRSPTTCGRSRTTWDRWSPTCSSTQGGLPEDLVARYEVEGAAPVDVDQEEIEKLGIRLREAILLSERAEAGVRHDSDRLAEEVCEAALVRL